MRTRITINRHKVASNKKGTTSLPVVSVQDYKSTRFTNTAIILDADLNEVARVVYRPDAPLKCGATCWIETNLQTSIEGEF